MKLLTIGDTTINMDLVTAIRPVLQEPDDLVVAFAAPRGDSVFVVTLKGTAAADLRRWLAANAEHVLPDSPRGVPDGAALVDHDEGEMAVPSPSENEHSTTLRRRAKET